MYSHVCINTNLITQLSLQAVIENDHLERALIPFVLFFFGCLSNKQVSGMLRVGNTISKNINSKKQLCVRTGSQWTNP